MQLLHNYIFVKFNKHFFTYISRTVYKSGTFDFFSKCIKCQRFETSFGMEQHKCVASACFAYDCVYL